MSASPGPTPPAQGCRTIVSTVAGGAGDFAVIAVLILGLTAASQIINWQQLADDIIRGANRNGQQGQGAQSIEISPRLYPSGMTTASVTGDFEFSSELPVDEHASYTTPNGRSQIGFVDYANPDAGDVFIGLNEPGNYVTVSQGNTMAMAQDDACQFDIDVAPSSVSGTVSCAAAQVLVDGQPSGTSSINLQFSLTSVPWDGEDGGPDPYENLPTDEPAASE